LDQLTSYEISEWEAFDKIEPIGIWKDDYRLAYLSSLITNLTISTHGKKSAKFTNPIDFMLDWDVTKEKSTEVPKQSVEDMKAILQGIAKSVNKNNVRQTALQNRPPKSFKPTKQF
jgi:hypothetical protein